MPEERHDAYIQIKELSEREKNCLRCTLPICSEDQAGCAYNKDAVKTLNASRCKNWQQSNPEKYALARRRHYEQNREKVLAKAAQYREAKRMAKPAETV